MTFNQFKKTKFYVGMFKYMLTQYSEDFTKEVLKDLYLRAESQGTLNTYK